MKEAVYIVQSMKSFFFMKSSSPNFYDDLAERKGDFSEIFSVFSQYSTAKHLGKALQRKILKY